MKTKKMAQGAMYLALYGALLLIDRTIGSPLGDILPVLSTALIVTFSDDIRDCFIIAMGLLLIGFLFGSFTCQIYTPIGTIVGMFIVYRRDPKLGKRILTEMMAVYFLLEIIVAYIVYPIFGITIKQQISATEEFFISFGLPTVLAQITFILTIGILAIIESYLTAALIQLIRTIKQ